MTLSAGEATAVSYDRIRLLRLMTLSREGDRREEILLRQGKGWFTLTAAGHEALAVLADTLREDDLIFPHYRDKPLMLARGLSSVDMAREFYATRDSSSAGRQLLSHYSDRAKNVMSVLSPTGANVLPACGAAWGMALDGKDTVVLVCVGDAATRQGEFFEGICFAKERNLPIVILVEDNHYGISTPTSRINPVALKVLSTEDVVQIDGRCPDRVFEAGRAAVAKARTGDGPTVIWADLDRLGNHTSNDDHRLYRRAEDIAAMEARDPIKLFTQKLLSEGEITESEVEEMALELSSEVERDYRIAELAEQPKPEDTLTDVLGPEPEDVVPPLQGGRSWRMVDAVNALFHESLKLRKDLVFFGEDIEDPLGGVFRMTKGLSSLHPDHVFNSPLAEATILGVACGLACYGKRPVFELQFIDFVGPGWNQLVNNLATLRWRTNGQWQCPAVIYAPYGAYLPGGALWHSQANESVFSHYPGIRVVVPSTPQDAAGLLWTAMHASDPTLVLLPKHMMRGQVPVPENVPPVPFGKARIAQEGTDVTVVAWGNCLEIAEGAAGKLGKTASLEIIDLRSIVPWDREAVLRSVEKTGRLVVVQEDGESSSVGQMIITSLAGDPEVWKRLSAPPQLVSKPDVMIGFNPVHEYGCLPDIDKVVTAIKTTLDHSGRWFSGEQVSGDGREPSSTQESKAMQEEMPLPSGDQAKPSEEEKNLEIIRVPHIGEGLREAKVVSLLKNPGDPVARDESICELETDKSIVDIPATADGVLVEWKVAEGQTMEIGAELAVLETSGENGREPVAPPPPAATAASVPSALSHLVANQEEAREDEYELVSMTSEQRRLAASLLDAVRSCAPATLSTEAEWTAIRNARSEMKKIREQRRLAATPFMLAAYCVARISRSFPKLRSNLTPMGDMRIYKSLSLGVAVSREDDDLVTAVVKEADQLDWPDFVAAMWKQIKLARSGQNQIDQRTTLILSNMGDYGVQTAIPVVVPPSVATLFFSAPYDRVLPAENGDGYSHRPMVNLCLTFDHRVLNGAGAARILAEIKRGIETFELPSC